MIKIICGPKGFGKTKLIIEEANNAVDIAKGVVVFITDTKRYMYDLVHDIRFIDTKDYHVKDEDALRGFVKGIIAGNNDTEYVFIDGASRIADKPINEMEKFYRLLEILANNYNLNIIVTISSEPENLPEFLKKYL